MRARIVHALHEVRMGLVHQARAFWRVCDALEGAHELAACMAIQPSMALVRSVLRGMQCRGCWGGHMARCGQSRGWVAGQGPSANAQAAQRLVGVVRGARGGGVSVVVS